MPEAQYEVPIDLTPDTVVGHDGPFTQVDGTDLAYRVLNLQDDLVVESLGATVSVAMVEIESGGERFIRMVADDPTLTRDIRKQDRDPHGTPGDSQQLADTRIKTHYVPRSAPLIFAAHPGGLHLVYRDLRGQREINQAVRVGDTVELAPGLLIRPDAPLDHRRRRGQALRGPAREEKGERRRFVRHDPARGRVGGRAADGVGSIRAVRPRRWVI